MKYVCAAFMLFVLGHSIFMFWLHDLTGFTTGLITFLGMRYGLQQLKNDHQKN